MTPKTVLVADNEENIRAVLSTLLEREGYRVTAVANGEEAQQVLSHQHEFDCIITDLKMPQVDGMGLLRWVKDHLPHIPVIMITAFATVDTAVEALKIGAFDYITKPFDLDEMKAVVDKACRTRSLAQRDLSLRADDLELVGQNPMMKEIWRLVDKVANSPSPVLITGESGTGKGLVALALHQHSSRRDKPFIVVNCAAIPHGLIESELFGYERGAFTGAVGAKPGRFELAHRGTLFLDEIGEISPDVQVKLLRAIQHQTFERVGGLRTLQTDVRLVTATNRDLKRDIDQGRFREDLYYRLNVIPIHLPALRDRLDDLPLLIDSFVEAVARRLGKKPLTVAPQTLALLTRYTWPGNIRELENVIERAMVLSEGPTLLPTDLPAEFRKDLPAMDDAAGLKSRLKQQGAALERDMISRALDENDGNVTRTAKKLGISRKSLQLKMKQYGLR